jgi:hypothetical protein
VEIRTYQPGDEAAQVAIYNEATAALPKFKAATLDEVRRRMQDPRFDPSTHFYAVEGGHVIGYAAFQPNGRVSYPWCRKGCESTAEPLFQHLIQAMVRRGLKKAFAAYRSDWTAVGAFFQAHGFKLAREMVNFVLDLPDMPTPAARPSVPVAPLRPEDLPFVQELGEGVLRTSSREELEQHFFHHPYFRAESAFLLRSRGDSTPVAVGILIDDPRYADPHQVDAAMPCFRLGAFGTEGLTVKRINGLFSFLARPDRNLNVLAMDLMGVAATRLEKSDTGALAAQVPSDVPHLLRFYQQYFRRQGSFPVYERML